MELINEYIHLTVKQNTETGHSFCKITKDEAHIYLAFGLFANDCLFDLAGNNYTLLIKVQRSYLEKYKEPFEVNPEKHTICCNIQTKLLEIIHCDLKGIYRKIFIESTILFLLYQSQKNSILRLNCDHCDVFHKSPEIEKIQKARKFILDNLSNNLTIPVIAINVGTNQSYLKKRFKEVFNQTIFEFIQENRMIMAKHLLQKPNPKISEIAFRVGYSSLSSFSQSYKNYFHMTPTEQAKQKVSDN